MLSRIERTFALATVFVLLGGAVAWGLLSLRSHPGTVASGGRSDPGRGATAAPGAVAGPGAGPETPVPGSAAALGNGGTVPAGLRAPSGEDLSDPKRVKDLLRAYLSDPNPRWDWIASLLGVLADPLDADMKQALQEALVHGNAAGAIQAYQKLRDGSVVPDLLRLLDDPSLDAHDRNNLLVAISSIPAADVAVTVTGIESRLTGDYAHDLAYVQAIARVGGAEAARAIVDAIGRAPDPSKYGIEAWRSFDLTRSKEAADYLAGALRSTTLSPAALRAVVELAGRPGATPALVDSLLALDADAQPEAVRRQVMASLAATGDAAAVDRLIAIATKGADYASVAARALGSTGSASPAAREKMIETAKSTPDDFLRQNLVEGLGNVRAVTAVPLLTDLLGGGSDAVKKASAVALGRIGPQAASSVDALGAAYASGDEALRGHVAIALAEIGGDAARNLLEQYRVAEKSPGVKRIVEGSIRRIEAKKSRP